MTGDGQIGSILIRAGALGSAAAITRGSYPAETGGLLVGFERASDIYICDIVPVRGNIPLTHTEYERAHDLASACLSSYLSYQPPGSSVGYVGEWHSHPSPHSASQQDLTELSELAVSRQRLTALLVIGANVKYVTPFGYLCDQIGIPVPSPIHVADFVMTRDLDRS